MGKNRSPGHMCFFVLYHGFLSNKQNPLLNPLGEVRDFVFLFYFTDLRRVL